MQVIPKILRAILTAMTVKDPEETYLRPYLVVYFVLWLHYVKDDAHSVFVILANDALVGIRSV